MCVYERGREESFSAIFFRLLGLTPLIQTKCDRPTELLVSADASSLAAVNTFALLFLLWLLCTDLRLWMTTPVGSSLLLPPSFPLSLLPFPLPPLIHSIFFPQPVLSLPENQCIQCVEGGDRDIGEGEVGGKVWVSVRDKPLLYLYHIPSSSLVTSVDCSQKLHDIFRGT